MNLAGTCGRAALGGVTVLLLAFGPVSSARAATSEFAGYNFHFRSAEYNYEGGNFIIPQRFRATRKERTIEGDRVKGNALKKTFVAQGHVVVHQMQAIGGSSDVSNLTMQPSTLTCDRLDANVAAESYTAIGNVHFFETGRDAVADRGSFDSGLSRLHMEGHVVIRDGETTLVAQAVDYDVRTGEFSSPQRFSIERTGSSVAGDRGQGNAHSQIFNADGNVHVDRAPSVPGADSNPLNAKASHLTSDHLQADGLSKVYVASGNVHFAQERRDATADRGTLDDARHVLTMAGDVHVRDGDRRVAANSVDYNIASGEVRASDNVTVSTPGTQLQTAAVAYNIRIGAFSTQTRFKAIRAGSTIEGDHATGNALDKTFVATGNVVVHQLRSLGRGGLASFARNPATLTTDRLEVDAAKGAYTAIGNAHFVQTSLIDQLDRDAVADRMHFDEKKNRLHLEGNVKVREGKSMLVAKTADYDVNSGNFKTLERFSFTREATQIEGDKGEGNTKSLKFTVAGNVAVNQTGPLQGRGDISKLTEQPSTLTTDRLDVDGLKRYYVATGKVHFTQVERDATSKHGTLDDQKHLLHMDGNVKIRDGDRKLDADIVDYNTLTGDVHASGNVVGRAPGAEFAAPVPAPSESASPPGRKKPS